MNERLQPLCFLPPPTGLPWVVPPVESSRFRINRAEGSAIQIDVPLFWNDPPWYQTDCRIADMVAASVASTGVLVSALRRDLEELDEPLTLHDGVGVETDDETASDDVDEVLPRIVPYRPERYGLSGQDFDGARIIDVRLAIHCDPSGRFAYSAQQLERWEPTDEDDRSSDESSASSWTPAATFPPDVASLDQLASKLNQLRRLSPTAALFVSIAPHRMNVEIPKLVAAKPDGLILLLNELPLSGLELGMVTRHARRLLNNAGGTGIPLWVVPGEITPDDAVKLVVLGASGVAIDDWCHTLIEQAEEVIETSPAARLGHAGQRELEQPLVQAAVNDLLTEPLERFKGLLHRMQSLPAAERLGSLDQEWAKMFEVPWIGLGRVQGGQRSEQPAAD